MYRDSVDTEIHFYVPMYGLLSTYDSWVPSKKSLQVATPWVERPWPQGARLRYCGRRRRRARSASTSLGPHLMSILLVFSGNYGIAEWYFMGYYQQQPDTGRVRYNGPLKNGISLSITVGSPAKWQIRVVNHVLSKMAEMWTSKWLRCPFLGKIQSMNIDEHVTAGFRSIHPLSPKTFFETWEHQLKIHRDGYSTNNGHVGTMYSVGTSLRLIFEGLHTLGNFVQDLLLM